MKAELDDALCRDFPLLYRDRYADKTTSCMCWGFECDDGWEPMIRRLSEKLEKLIQDQLDSHIPMEDTTKASQIKSKFGSLRAYLDNGSDEAYEIVYAAEKESLTTCEVCGKVGKTVIRRSWMTTLCTEHAPQIPVATEHEKVDTAVDTAPEAT